MELPKALTGEATLLGSEYGWPIAAFPRALAAAESQRYACLGGQFQFRVGGSIREMYWLNADSADRRSDEPWQSYVSRSCAEVRGHFERLVAETDWCAAAAEWKGMLQEIGPEGDPMDFLVFVAYFVSEFEARRLTMRSSGP